MYYLSFRVGIIARPREVSLGGATSAASRDAARAAPPPEARDRLGFRAEARKALRLLLWVVVDSFLVF